MTAKTMKALKNRDAEQEGQCRYAGNDKNIPQTNGAFIKPI
eukprot:CAMPEP_0172595864 /NCGR_PEP_ID=MMETSP1068-20121228/15529_1 /TAXON_ID=35684 /ORGANISM="Pseudopedinella elastica, Strain CCMP716" /LENGTH=40 /DNA_ID= /DNA_START= /DNA_END= /DNA_ORIENTATION=